MTHVSQDLILEVWLQIKVMSTITHTNRAEVKIITYLQDKCSFACVTFIQSFTYNCLFFNYVLYLPRV